MAELFAILIDGIGHAVNFLKAIEVFSGVSLWSFMLSVIIITILFNLLVNVVRAQSANKSVRKNRSKNDDGGS